MFGAPIEGLRPLISEPVYFRSGLSAFGNPGFATELRGGFGRAEDFDAEGGQTIGETGGEGVFRADDDELDLVLLPMLRFSSPGHAPIFNTAPGGTPAPPRSFAHGFLGPNRDRAPPLPVHLYIQDHRSMVAGRDSRRPDRDPR